MHFNKPKLRALIKKAGRKAATVLVILFQFSLISTILFRVVPVPVTPLMLLRDAPIRKDWVSMKNISKAVPRAAIASEDPKFLTHNGFDFEQIQESVEQKFKKDKKLRGASTISQQTAKNVFLYTARSWIRKGAEVYFTLLLESYWNKKRIMEVYLNIIEMGDGIYGIEAAAQKYFKKPASKLTAREAALIVACFPNPRRWTPDKATPYILRKQGKILIYMSAITIPKEWYP